MTDLQGLLDRTSAAIVQVGAPDDAAWRFARAWILATRYDQGERVPADLAGALEDFEALPGGFPGRPKLASVLVTSMVRTERMKDPGDLARAVALTAVANEDPRPLAEWPATAAAVRARSLLESAMHGSPGFSVRAALKELDGLAVAATGVRPQQDLVEFARVGLTLMRDMAENNVGELLRSPDRIRALHELLSTTAAGKDPRMRPKLTALAAAADAAAAVARGDLTAAVTTVRAGQEAVRSLPADDAAHRMLTGMLATLQPMVDLHDSVVTAPSSSASVSAGSSSSSAGSSSAGNLAELLALAEAPGLSAAERAIRLLNLGLAEMGFGFESDEQIDSAIGHLRAAVATAGAHDHRSVYYMSTLGTALLRRVEMLARRDDLAEAIQLLEKARTIAGSDMHAYWTILANPLAHAYRLSGQRVRGREVALSGLRGHAWNVLLQPTVADMQVTARHAAGDAIDVAGWCLQDNDPEAAATALDSGRALILYAATETRDLAERLAVSRPELAGRWREAVARDGAALAPGELRREVISALARIPLDAAGATQVPPDAGSARLLAPPGLDEVRAALSSLNVDALVYLMPGSDRFGAAVVIPAHEPPTWVPLPHLGRDWGADFDAFLTATSQASRVAGRPPGWVPPTPAGSLDDLCERAWSAAIAPVLSQVPGSAPRIVLIPMGELARIPWHAAFRTVDGRRRYALEDATFSYAPSARLLCDLTWRGAPPPASGCLIVADPDTAGAAADLNAARTEAWAVRDAFYPSARYVGRTPDGSPGPDGPGSRDDVLAWLGEGDAAAVLHLACHGVVEPGDDSGDTSYLLLSGGERLSAEELVSSAAAVGRPIALAVLGACSSGVCGRGDDEAYSLSTTLLATNVATVVGTQWSVPDSATSVLMFMFHHYLRAEGLPPAEALRQAQLWMIGPRKPPASMPARLSGVLGSDLAAPGAWAAFVHFGR